jgi:hypothetical protein
MSVSAPAAMCADDAPNAPRTIGSLPSIPLSLEGTSASQPSERSSDLAWNSEVAFDWKAWAVVGFAGIVLVGIRLISRRAVFKMPSDVFELLGEATLGGGQPVRVVRFGPKTLLVSVGSGGPKTLSELDDPLATEWIAAACRGEQTLRSLASHSMTVMIRVALMLLMFLSRFRKKMKVALFVHISLRWRNDCLRVEMEKKLSSLWCWL